MTKFTQRIFVALTVACSLSPMVSFGQGAYGGAKPYDSAKPGTVTSAPSAAPATKASAVQASVPVPLSRPAPAAPMPTPLPTGIDKVQTAVDSTAPMTAAEMTELMKTLFERQQAAQQNVTGRPPAKPITSVETLDLSPNAIPPVIRVAMGQGATLSFSDSAGRPWPLADNMNFNGRAYDGVLIGPHLYTITLKSREAASVAVVLKDLPRPIVISVMPATDETDLLKEYTVPRFLDGVPPASVAASSREGALAFNSPELLNYLYRTPPKGARPLTVDGLPGVMAWQTSGNKMVVRTSGQVVIPAFSRRHAASDGVAVYEVPLSPIVSITEGGALHRVSIGGYSVETSTAAAK